MLNFSGKMKIFVHADVTDMRKGFQGLSAIVREQFESDPTDGSLFIFINRRRDRMKLLHFVDGGFWLYYRSRLRCSSPPTAPRSCRSMPPSCRCCWPEFRWPLRPNGEIDLRLDGKKNLQNFYKKVRFRLASQSGPFYVGCHE